VRAVVGARLAPVLEAAWAGCDCVDDPRVRAAVVRDLAALPDPTPATREATMTMLEMYGGALLAIGRPDEGRRALLRAIELARPHDSPGAEDAVTASAIQLAIEAAQRRDSDEALRWATRALERTPTPELAADRLLLDPDVAVLAVAPSWLPIRSLTSPVIAP
jgi:hypothetical protein